MQDSHIVDSGPTAKQKFGCFTASLDVDSSGDELVESWVCILLAVDRCRRHARSRSQCARVQDGLRG